jgi:hypothetical protein
MFFSDDELPPTPNTMTNQDLSLPHNMQPAAVLASSRVIGGTLLISLVMVVALLLAGRVWWCPAGDWAITAFVVASQHNSQHLVDWYSPSHFSHGLLFYLALVRMLATKLQSYLLLIVVTIEASWEVLENSPIIISRYRSATSAFDYTGDSICNSLSDVVWCILGFFVAKTIGLGKTLLLFVALELFTLYYIRDNLVLNVIMLTFPIAGIKEWQIGAM